MDRISFSCSACGAALSVPSEKTGAKGKCPKCGGIMQAPQSAAATAHEERKEGFTDNPPTEKQLAYAYSLATDRQKAYAASLGIQFAENVTKGEISRLIDAEQDRRLEKMNIINGSEVLLSKATPKDMVDEITLRHQGSGVAIMVIWDFREGADKLKESVAFSAPLSAKDAKTWLFNFSRKWAGIKIPGIPDE